MASSRSLIHQLTELYGRQVVVKIPFWKGSKPLTGKVIGWIYDPETDKKPYVDVRYSDDLPSGWAKQVETCTLDQIQVIDETPTVCQSWPSPKYWFNQSVTVFEYCFKLHLVGRIMGLEYDPAKGWQYAIGINPADHHSQVEPTLWVDECEVILKEFHKPQINETLAALMPAPLLKEPSQKTCC